MGRHARLLGQATRRNLRIIKAFPGVMPLMIFGWNRSMCSAAKVIAMRPLACPLLRQRSQTDITTRVARSVQVW
jgi:hypothetical protein